MFVDAAPRRRRWFVPGEGKKAQLQTNPGESHDPGVACSPHSIRSLKGWNTFLGRQGGIFTDDLVHLGLVLYIFCKSQFLLINSSLR